MNAPPGQDASPLVMSDIDSTAKPSKTPAMSPASSNAPVASQDLSAHHRILALNKAWEEKRAKEADQRRIGQVEDDSSSTDSDSSADIVSIPRTHSTLQLSGPAFTPIATPDLSRAGGPRISQTPVPLPDFAHRASTVKTQAPSSKITTSTSTSQEEIPSAPSTRAQALRFTEESALKHLEHCQAETNTTKDRSDSTELHFATPGELVARIRQSAQNSPASFSQPQITKAPPTANDSSATTEISQSTSGGDDGGEDGDNDDISSDDVPMLDSEAEPRRDQQGHYLFTLDGRPYTTMQNPNGVPESNRGILIPTNYKLYHEHPRYICPVRDCQCLLKSITSLSAHFCVKHFNRTFNDNLDGTITLVAERKGSGPPSSSVIVSQKPLSPGAQPPAEPAPPIWKRTGSKQSSVEGSTSSSMQKPLVETRTSGKLDNDLAPIISDIACSADLIIDPCDHLLSFLPSNQITWRREDIRAMSELPFRRELPAAWIAHHKNNLLDAPLFASALAYIVGDEITGPAVCKKKYGPAGRLSDKCIALPSHMSETVKRVFHKVPTCVGCFYRSFLQRQRNTCDWAEEGWSDTLLDAPEDAVPVESTASAVAKRILKEESRDSEPEATNVESAGGRTLASSRTPRFKRPADADSQPKSNKVMRLADVADRPEAITEMESWEMAPGKIMDSESGEIIAHSGAYMINPQPLQVLPDIGLNALAINCGESIRWTAEPNKLRCCMVASGKVRVTTRGTSFILGPHGSFQVKPDQACVVENRFYYQAIIHCFSLRNYDLVE